MHDLVEFVPKKVEDYLKEIDYSPDPDYVPTEFALKFITFIKLVHGGEPENKSPVIHYKMLDNFNCEEDTINACHRGVAKALSVDSQILTPNGNVRMSELKVGDQVFSRTGRPTAITHKSEIFTKKMYEICLADGRKLVVSEDHLNIVQKRRTGKRSLPGFNEYTLTTKELLDKGVIYSRKISDKCPTGSESKWFIPTAEAIELPEVECPLDPYTIGAILGDGSINKETGFTRFHVHISDLDHFVGQFPYEISAIRSDK